MERWFTIDEARAMMPAVHDHAGLISAVRAEMAERSALLRAGDRTQLPEVKGLEAMLNEHLEWFVAQGIQLKGYAPILVDFPMRHGDRTILLCWLENEPTLDWYHDAEQGFLGRRLISEL